MRSKSWGAMLAGLVVLLGMVGMGERARRLAMPFSSEDEWIKLWVVAAIGIAAAGCLVWRFGGEAVLAVMRGRWRELRLFERQPWVEETFETERPFAEVVADLAERLAGLKFTVQPPEEAEGGAVRIVAEKPKTQAAVGMLYSGMGAVIDVEPRGEGARGKVRLMLRTFAMGDVGKDREKLRAIARYVTGETERLDAVTHAPVALEMGVVEAVMLVVIVGVGRTDGAWGRLGEAGQVCTLSLVVLAMVQIARNRRTTTGMAGALLVGLAGAWPMAVRGAEWLGAGNLAGVQLGYAVAGVVAAGAVGWWWERRVKVARVVVELPVAVKERRLGWAAAVVMGLGIMGTLMTGMGAVMMWEAVRMTTRADVTADDLAAGRMPRGQWVRLTGEVDWDWAVWVQEGHTKAWFVPVFAVKGGGLKVGGVVRVLDEELTAARQVKIVKEGGEGVMMWGGLPERARYELEKEGLVVVAEPVVVMDGRMPADEFRDGMMVGGIGGGAWAVGGGLWWWRRRRSGHKAVEERVAVQA